MQHLQQEAPEGLRQSTLGILRDDSNTPRLMDKLPIVQAKLKLSEGKEEENDSDYYDYISSSTATEKPDKNALRVHNSDLKRKNSGQIQNVEQIKFGFFNDVESPNTTPRQNQESKTRQFTLNSSRTCLPQCKLQASFGISSSQIMKVFEEVCKAKSFQIIEMEELLATAVYREPFSFKKLFSYCIPSKDKSQNKSSMVSAIKLHIHVSQSTLTRKIYVKGFYGVVPILKGFVKEFRKKMQKEIEKVDLPEDTSYERPRRDSRQSMRKNPIEKKEKSYSQIQSYSDEEGEDGSAMNQTLREKSSKYEFQKILSSQKYSLGKNIAEYISTFNMQYRSIEESAELLPQPMDGLVQIVNETVNAFYHQYNFGRSEKTHLMKFCRPSVQKFVFSQVYEKLIQMYQLKYKKQDERFASKRQKIEEKFSPVEAMKFLDIPGCFILAGEGTSKSTRRPFESSIKKLERICEEISPYEKLNCVAQAFSDIKSTIVVHYKGEKELDKQDDILPLFIYIVSQSGVLNNLVSDYNYMQDYLNCSTINLDLEKKLIVNLEVSIQYIQDEWLEQAAQKQ